MFIAHVAGKSSLAPEERNVPLAKENISLLWSFRAVWGSWFYKQLVPLGPKTSLWIESEMKSLTNENTRLGFIGIGNMISRIARRLLKHGYQALQPKS